MIHYVYAPDHQSAEIYIHEQGLPKSPLETRVVINGAMNLPLYRPEKDDTVHVLPGADAPAEAAAKAKATKAKR